MADFDRQYWKIKDFAEHFGLDKSTVYNKIERGGASPPRRSSVCWTAS
jgi:predicted DNA-binding transcriptional regulator AlpA